MSYIIQAGDVGVAITVYVNPQQSIYLPPNYNLVDTRTATSILFKIQPPGGTAYSVLGIAGSIDGTALGSYAQYVSTASDFTTPGNYTAQVTLTFGPSSVRQTNEFIIPVGPSL